jgi:hypothetical protein
VVKVSRREAGAVSVITAASVIGGIVIMSSEVAVIVSTVAGGAAQPSKINAIKPVNTI